VLVLSLARCSRSHSYFSLYVSQNRYKDPTRGDASFAIMLAEKADAEERAANPKAGDAPGCAGCKVRHNMIFSVHTRHERIIRQPFFSFFLHIIYRAKHSLCSLYENDASPSTLDVPSL
jgi:hypothetical protein